MEGKVAIITGGGSGIGRATAELFAKKGAKVSVVDKNAATCKETVEMIEKAGGEAMSYVTDVSKPDDVKEIINGAANKYGRIDVLFNNAGITCYKPVTETPEEEWDAVMNVNLKGVFLGTKYVVPVMKKQGGGVIINTASECAVSGFPTLSAYCASKAGVHLFTKAVAVELAPYNIRVNCVSPGRILTPMHTLRWKQLPEGEAEKQRKEMTESIPIGRMGKPEDVANLVLYLASDLATFVTGANFSIDGGSTI